MQSTTLINTLILDNFYFSRVMMICFYVHVYTHLKMLYTSYLVFWLYFSCLNINYSLYLCHITQRCFRSPHKPFLSNSHSLFTFSLWVSFSVPSPQEIFCLLHTHKFMPCYWYLVVSPNAKYQIPLIWWITMFSLTMFHSFVL